MHGKTDVTAHSRRDLSNKLRVLVFVLIAGLFLSESGTVNSQIKEEGIRVDTNLVLVNVLVLDRNGTPVIGLKSEQFEIFDDGVNRPVESFSAEEAPVSFGIIYDMHPTTAERTRSVIESLRLFGEELKPADEIFLVAFNMQGEQTFDFIPTYDQLEKHMSEPGKREPFSLYDAIYFASDRIQSSRSRKRMLLLISDSADHSSRHTFSELREKVSDVKAEVYAVIVDGNHELGYTDITHKSRESRPFPVDALALDRAAIQDLTLKSGGGTFLAGSQHALRLFAIYKQVSREMRSHYTLGFYPELIDAKQHRIRIRLRNVEGSKNFALTYRMSYQHRPTTARQ